MVKMAQEKIKQQNRNVTSSYNMSVNDRIVIKEKSPLKSKDKVKRWLNFSMLQQPY
jgi:hypothetical protein